MVTSWRKLLLLLLVWGLWVGTASALSVTAMTGQDSVALGESLELQLKLDGSPDVDPDLAPLQQDWEVLSRGQSSQRQYRNGHFTSSFIYTLALMPRREGNLVIPPVCFGKDCSLALPIEVTRNSTLGATANDQILLETSLNTKKTLPQAQVLLKVRLSVMANLPEGQLTEPVPTGVKAVVKKLTDVRKYERRNNGQTYQVFERDYAIFPQSAGQMQIPPLQYDGVIAGGRTRFDLSGRQGMRVRRTSEPLQVEVAPLPADLGRRPWIPATSVVLKDSWQQQLPKFVVGEPATRTLSLSAEGGLSVQLPALDPTVPESFKVYPDQPQREDSLIRSGVKGTLEQKVSLVPTRPGSYQLPAVELSWWDLTTGQWRQARLAALDIEVAPAPSAGVAPVVPPAAQAEQQKKAPKAEAESTLAAVASPASEADAVTPPELGAKIGYWPWLSLVLALGWLLTLIIFWRSLRSRRAVAEQSSSRASDGKQAAQRSVIQAALGNDARGARQALISWSRALWPDMETGSYERLKLGAEGDLQAAMNLLDTHLYACSEGEWQGAELARLVKEATFDNGAKREGRLPELYP